MDTNVIFIDEQVYWHYQLPSSQKEVSPKFIFPLDGKDLLIAPSKMSEVYRPRNLFSAVIREGW